MQASRLTYYDFFAGGGMAGLGLGPRWSCLFANDIDQAKAGTYRANFGAGVLRVADVNTLSAHDLPGRANLAWASSPCQDVSLAGRRAGLAGARSSAFWGFWRLMRELDREGRAPGSIVIENVTGLLTSHGGADFTAVCEALGAQGYRFGALEIDAAAFVPQSRPRLFLVATRALVPAGFRLSTPAPAHHSDRVAAAAARLSEPLRRRWVWWRLPPPQAEPPALADLLEPDEAVAWLAPERTAALIGQLSEVHRAKLAQAQEDAAATGVRRVGALFRRTRVEGGHSVQRAELRFDGLAGCLRTPGGGSSRQFLVTVDGTEVRARLMTPREAARLMGLPDSYVLPSGSTAALHVVGDGVAPPVVRHLADSLLTALAATPIACRSLPPQGLAPVLAAE